MSQRLLLFKGIVLAILLLVLIPEFLFLYDSSAPSVNSEQPFVNSDHTYKNYLMPMEKYAEMVDRPLFLMTRRPPPKQVIVSEAQIEVQQIREWSLIGVFRKGDKSVALFSKRGEGKILTKVSENDHLSGWLVSKINNNSVVLELNGNFKTIDLRQSRPQASINYVPHN
jgi:hypothetical protein